MKLRYLRNFGLGILSFLMISSQAYASADREVRINELEHQMKQVGTETAIGTYGANTATARPEVDGRWWFDGSICSFGRTPSACVARSVSAPRSYCSAPVPPHAADRSPRLDETTP